MTLVPLGLWSEKCAKETLWSLWDSGLKNMLKKPSGLSGTLV